MLCNVCKQNEAKVHLTKIVGDKMQKVDLCEDCSKEKGVDDPTNFSLTDVLLGKVAEEVAELTEAEPAEASVKCPTCGYTQADFKKAGRFGCSDCYTTFGEGLEPMLKTMHKGIKHTGKVPAALQQSRAEAQKIKQLQKRLDKAVAEENFEEAAQLRDEIKRMK
ncbi:MAG: excinuclease ABC subunit B [Verrucomicrobia bacterium]|nr:excinuclease ABC subunit B [Verrucomicrobiota bacterium]MBM3871663.1 excinuclease ABC subunit B [Verrucomicrobiota bacterium]